MDCPHCASPLTVLLPKATSLGYSRFSCQRCARTFNARTGTPFNFLEVPTDIMFQVLLWRLHYKLSLRDLAEMFLLRGFSFTHETVRDWEVRFGPLLGEHLRRRRRKRAGRTWYVDETYLAVKGRWLYLYRAIDSDGELVDVMLSEHRDMAAAKAFFESAQSVVGRKPKEVMTDGHTPYPRAIRETLGKGVEHRVIPCVGNPVEQDHRGIKQRYYPTLGFKAFANAAAFCRASEEVRNYFRPRRRMGDVVSLSDRRQQFIERYRRLQDHFCEAA
jgi:transposase-like protein